MYYIGDEIYPVFLAKNLSENSPLTHQKRSPA